MHPSAVPASMIERATERRLAGDWPGAYAAAGVENLVDLGLIRRTFGDDAAARIEDDLRHLVPDLLRWYLVRDHGALPRPHVWYPLVLLPDDHAVMVHTLPFYRIRLTLGRVVEQRGRRDDSFLLLRDRWDARRTREILARCGFFNRPAGGLVTTLLQLDDDGRHAAAWAAAGYDLRVLLFDRRFGRDRLDPAAFAIDPATRSRARGAAVNAALAWPRPIHTTLPAAARRTIEYVEELLATEPYPTTRHAQPGPRIEADTHLGLTRIDVKGRSIVLDGARARLVSRVPRGQADAERRRAEMDEFGIPLDRIPRIPDVLVHRPAELDALRRGSITLHPLVHEALFSTAALVLPELSPTLTPVEPALSPPRALVEPARPSPRTPVEPAPSSTRASVEPALSSTRAPVQPALSSPRAPLFFAPTRLRMAIPVHCDHATHEVVMRDGAMVIPHTRAEIDREMALAALGGQVQGCVAAREGWRDLAVQLPRRFLRLHDELLLIVRLGDTAALVDALDRGLDPHVRFRPTGESLLHLLPHIPGGDDLAPRLLAAGVDPNARTTAGRTPLHEAVAIGSVRLVKTLLKAGADPKAKEREHGFSYAAGWTNRPDLAFLRKLVT
ncbi:ankyrin repeat domain-containing protein [Dactylosporangium sp. CS-047395]|uniref:ankyrin repeat domain-containing protein n=1 Tax=Dactylosporangium sp. CS-047395 TaxID=3239936 RepID=UPI003D92A020